MIKMIDRLNRLPVKLVQTLTNKFGSIEKFYATIYLMAHNEHQCTIQPIPAVDQRLKTIRAYQGIVRFMLGEGGSNGKELLDGISEEYLEDFINYREKDFGLTNEEFVSLINKIV